MCWFAGQNLMDSRGLMRKKVNIFTKLCELNLLKLNVCLEAPKLIA